MVGVRKSRRSRYALLLGPWVMLVVALVLHSRTNAPASHFSTTRQLSTVRAAARSGPDFRLLIDTGSPETARDYALHVQERTGFPTDGTIDDLLAFCGYPQLKARNLETSTPATLMASIPGRLLATRFFAPDLAEPPDPQGESAHRYLAWRTIVRLVVEAGSPAAARGLGSVYLLFTLFQPTADLAPDPFEQCRAAERRCSDHNQVILVPKSVAPPEDAAYWLAFENTINRNGRRTDHVTARFAGGDHGYLSPDGSGAAIQYLPNACAQCHGNSAATGRLQFLNSDHWFERKGADYSDVPQLARHGVLFDGGADTRSATFRQAFDVLRKLNTLIHDQNVMAGGDDAALRGVNQWLTLHARDSGFASLTSRALPPLANRPDSRAWSGDVDDTALLGLLDRHCYRCHSAVAYDVFDKEAVFLRRLGMAARVELRPLLLGAMPPDRDLDPAVRQALANRLRGMR